MLQKKKRGQSAIEFWIDEWFKKSRKTLLNGWVADLGEPPFNKVCEEMDKEKI